MKKVKIPFSLDEYQKGGYEVESKFCDSVRIVCTDAKGAQPILALLFRCGEESDKRYSEDGRYYPSGPSDYDLVLVKYDFEDGDIVHTSNRLVDMISIFKELYKGEDLGKLSFYAEIYYGEDYPTRLNFGTYCSADNIRLATDEEKKILFDALAKKGKRWNAETKQIEAIEDKKENNWVSSGIVSTNEVIFRKEDNGLRRGCFVLCRDSEDGDWELDIFGRKCGKTFICVGLSYRYCIPFDSETEHLHGMTEDCPLKYKTWED